MQPYSHGLNRLQKISMSLMAVLVLLTFLGTNLQALFWQSSHWLVSTVLPAVVVDLTNIERVQNNRAPLVRNPVLDAAAQRKAEDMAKYHYFSHYSPTGVSPWYWFDEVGYVYAHAGENLAVHFTDSKEVVDAWMNSPSHRENIVGPQYTEIGVGTAKGTYEGYDTVFVVQLFGTPAVAPAPKPVAPPPAPKPVVAENVVEEVLPEPASDTAATELAPEVTIVAPNEIVESAAVAVDEIISEETTSVVKPAQTPFSVETITLGTEESPETVIIASQLIATSSGLAVAQATTPNLTHAEGTISSIVTQPNTLLQVIYTVLGTLVFLLLISSIILEVRRARMVQVAYGVMLLVGMGVLWYINVLLTSGAVVA